MNPLHDILHEKKVSEVAVKDVATLKATDTIEDAVKLFDEKKILSAPVLKGKEAIGIIDLLDIAAFIVSVAPSSGERATKEELEQAGRAMALKQVSDVVGFSGRDPLVAFNENDNVSFLSDLFATGVHRAVVTSNDDEVVGVVAQADIVKLLQPCLHEGSGKDMGAMELKTFGVGVGGQVVGVSKKSSLLETIEHLQDYQVSAVALTEDDGKLAGNFSVSDLKGLCQERVPSFAMTVADYLEAHSPASLNAIVTRSDASLLTAINTMLESHIHRVWVVDDDYKPQGIVSMTDIFKIVRDFEAPAHVGTSHVKPTRAAGGDQGSYLLDHKGRYLTAQGDKLTLVADAKEHSIWEVEHIQPDHAGVREECYKAYNGHYVTVDAHKQLHLAQERHAGAHFLVTASEKKSSCIAMKSKSVGGYVEAGQSHLSISNAKTPTKASWFTVKAVESKKQKK